MCTESSYSYTKLLTLFAGFYHRTFTMMQSVALQDVASARKIKFRVQSTRFELTDISCLHDFQAEPCLLARQSSRILSHTLDMQRDVIPTGDTKKPLQELAPAMVLRHQSIVLLIVKPWCSSASLFAFTVRPCFSTRARITFRIAGWVVWFCLAVASATTTNHQC